MTDQHPQAWCDRNAALVVIYEALRAAGIPDEMFTRLNLSGAVFNALLASGLISRKPSEDEVAEMLIGANVGYHHHRLVIARAVLSAKGEGV